MKNRRQNPTRRTRPRLPSTRCGCLQKQQGDAAGKVDQLSGQINRWNDTLDEPKVRLAKVSKQLEDMQSSQQALPHSNRRRRRKLRQAQAPPPDVLYANALRDYTQRQERYRVAGILRLHQVLSQHRSGREFIFTLAAGFSSARAIKRGRCQLRSGNAELEWKQAASAQLKKGFVLIEMGQKDDGVQELRGLIQRYPRRTGDQAMERLRKLSTAAASKPGI